MVETARLEVRLDPTLDKRLIDELIEVWTDVTNAGGAVGFVPTVTVEQVRPMATRMLDKVDGDESHLVVAWLEGAVAGFAFIEHRPGPLFRHWATIKRLQVRPDLQGSGYGAELLAACEEVAEGLGLEQIHLTVRGGTGTEAFYERSGYSIVSRIPEMIRVAPGEDREELYMIKRLGERPGD